MAEDPVQEAMEVNCSLHEVLAGEPEPSGW